MPDKPSPKVALVTLKITSPGQMIATFDIGKPGGDGPAMVTIDIRLAYDNSDTIAVVTQKAFEACAHGLEWASGAARRIRGH